MYRFRELKATSVCILNSSLYPNYDPGTVLRVCRQTMYKISTGTKLFWMLYFYFSVMNEFSNLSKFNTYVTSLTERTIQCIGLATR